MRICIPTRTAAAARAVNRWAVPILKVALVTFAASQFACSQASRTLHYSSRSPEPGVVYVAEQVYGLDDWARRPDSRTYARVTTHSGNAEEGPLVRITTNQVVMATTDSRGEEEVTIDKENILFMRVWW
jgi:hypothetical protein